MKRRLMDYFDIGLHLCQADGDGGDSLNRNGAVMACSDDFIERSTAMVGVATNEGICGEGRYCRNPAPGRWYSNPNNTTRDQMQAVEAGWAVMGRTEIARRHFRQRIKRLMFHFSHENDGYDSGLPLVKKFPDAPSPTELCTIIRAGQYSILRPLLYTMDLAFVLEVAIFRRFAPLRDWDWDHSFLPMLIAAKKVWPTFWIRLAIKLYAKIDVPARLRHYHSEANGANGIEPLGELMVNAYLTHIREEKV